MEFSVGKNKITHIITGEYDQQILLKIQDNIKNFNVLDVEKLWENVSNESGSSISSGSGDIELNIDDICHRIYSQKSSHYHYVVMKLMELYGSVYFSSNTSGSASSGSGSGSTYGTTTTTYTPLPPLKVQENLSDRAALNEFKQWFNKMSIKKFAKKSTQHKASNSYYSDGSSSGGGNGGSSTRIPERIQYVLNDYEDNLMQLVAKGHPWVVCGTARRKIDNGSVERGKCC